MSFNGETLQFEVRHGSSFHLGEGVVDFRADDNVAKVVLRHSDDYIFNYATAVSLERYDILRLSRSGLKKIELRTLPDSTPAKLRQLNNQAVDLANGNLWLAAQLLIKQTQEITPDNEIVFWNANLINLNVEGQSKNANNGYPLSCVHLTLKLN